MLDDLAVLAPDALTLESLPDRPREVGQSLDVIEIEVFARLIDQKKPIAAPCDITGNVNINMYIFLVPIARDVAHGDIAGCIQLGADDADWSLNAVHAYL